jgi:hypothetical protein
MFGSETLEIVIGLVFIYLLFSMLVTLINEYISSIFRLRAGTMKQIIEKMLNDEDGGISLSSKFTGHPLVKYLSKKANKYPSYLSAEKFSKVVLDIIRTTGDHEKLGKSSLLDEKSLSDSVEALDSTDQSETIRLMKTFAKESAEDINLFGKKLESWFNETAERSLGWFNRKMKIITFIVSFVIAVGINVDSVKIFGLLSENADTRAEIVQSAGDYLAKESIDKTDTTLQAARERLQSFYKEEIQPSSNMLGLGWGSEARSYFGSHWFLSILGWIITALAISLGAPFWFDVLNKVTKLRAAGKPTEKAQETQDQVRHDVAAGDENQN